MKLLDLLRGHFCLLIGQEFKTLYQGNTFTIEQVTDWLVVLIPSEGDEKQRVYLSDILRTYTWIIDQQQGSWIYWKDIKESRVPKIGSNLSYILPLIATFDDIESRPGGKVAAIRFIPEGFDE